MLIFKIFNIRTNHKLCSKFFLISLILISYGENNFGDSSYETEKRIASLNTKKYNRNREGKKAEPDVQDIIDGIVKLLGGKVKNNNVTIQHPHLGGISAIGIPSQHHPSIKQSSSYIHPLPPYNLFNPHQIYSSAQPKLQQNLQKFQQQSKPSRINDRAPLIPSTNTFPNQFEAIPLELLHNSPNISIGPPSLKKPSRLPITSFSGPIPNPFRQRQPILHPHIHKESPLFNKPVQSTYPHQKQSTFHQQQSTTLLNHPIEEEDDEKEFENPPNWINLYNEVKNITEKIGKDSNKHPSTIQTVLTSSLPTIDSIIELKPTKSSSINSILSHSSTTETIEQLNSSIDTTREANSTNSTGSTLIFPSSNTEATPPLLLRPGIVLPVENNDSNEKGSVEIVTNQPNQDSFLLTVTAQQGFGDPQPTQIAHGSVEEEIITKPNSVHQFVSIDGKRSYFGGATSSHIIPSKPTKTSAIIGTGTIRSHEGIVGEPVYPFAQSTKKQGSSSISSTSNIVRRPSSGLRSGSSSRPSIPPIRIDTCIVGDDSTCSNDSYESCRMENGVSSCMCRPGYARKRHRESCIPIMSLTLSLRIDKLREKKINYTPDLFNPASQLYLSLEWELSQGLESIFGEGKNFDGGWFGSRLEGIGFDGRQGILNSTIFLNEGEKEGHQLKRELQKYLIESLGRSRNQLGRSNLWVEGPISAIGSITDFDECSNPDWNDCDINKGICLNTYGSFQCKCGIGYGDQWSNHKRKSGRHCSSCNGKIRCNNRGECLIINGEEKCRCHGNFYGSQCEIDGEVLGVAIGASVIAILIIALTLTCLCMWSRRWKREEQKANLMSRSFYGGGISNATNGGFCYMGKDERFRWINGDPLQFSSSQILPHNGNLYITNDPPSFPPLVSTPPSNIGNPRRSTETSDSSLDDVQHEERFHINKTRPKSRSSQFHGGYGEFDGGCSDIYNLRGTSIPPSTIVPNWNAALNPSQFLVPMNPYPNSRSTFQC